MRAGLLSCALVLAGVALVPACADGRIDPASDTFATMPDDVSSGSDCAACPAGYVCSSGRCMRADVDFDGDGHPARVDCDDRDPRIFPGALEICNGKDDDCDGRIDEGFDEDGDGFFTCEREGQPADCDDTDPNVNPGASEVCNGEDDDCDGLIDELPAYLDAGLAPPDRHWARAGSAVFTNGWVELTPDRQYEAGALWWNATYVFDTFDASASFWLPRRSECADGLAFAFVPGKDVSAVGAVGHGYGVVGLGGFAVAIDTFANQGEPPAPFVAVVDATSGAHLARQAIPDVRDGQDHRLRVQLDDGRLTVWLDEVIYFSKLALPGYAPFAGRWGFTAATGALSCSQWVGAVSMAFPDGQGCVP